MAIDFSHDIVSCSWRLFFAGAVGLYVPGGTAVLPSSTLMMAVPAQIAGCKTIVMATPPRSDGQVLICWSIVKASVSTVLCMNLPMVG